MADLKRILGGLELITRKGKRELEKNTNYFFEFMKIKTHFYFLITMI